MVSSSKDAASSVSAQAQQEAVSEGIEAFELPRSIITRLARSAVREHFQRFFHSLTLYVCCKMSENTKMSKDVVLSFQKASTVFINYLGTSLCRGLSLVHRGFTLRSRHRPRGRSLETAQKHISHRRPQGARASRDGRHGAQTPARATRHACPSLVSSPLLMHPQYTATCRRQARAGRGRRASH